MSDLQERLYDLQGQLNQIMSTKTWLTAEGKKLITQIDELERVIQESHHLSKEQEVRMQVSSGCLTGECG